jgi:hypothetical protein
VQTDQSADQRGIRDSRYSVAHSPPLHHIGDPQVRIEAGGTHTSVDRGFPAATTERLV